MKHRLMFPIFLLALGLVTNSCKKDSDVVAIQTSKSAQDILKIGTTWIYEVSQFDSTGLIVHSGPAYYDTVKIIRDTIINNQKWFITSSYYRNGELYVVQAIGLQNGAYWKMIRGRTSFYDTVATSPLFKLNMKTDESFEYMYCMLTNLTEILYKRTLINSNTSVSAGETQYDCIYLKETKIVPDNVTYFEYQNYYYSPVYGLIKNEAYQKTSGGTIFRQSLSTLREIKIPD